MKAVKIAVSGFLILVLGLSSQAFAEKKLQLDIGGGRYSGVNPSEGQTFETVVAQSNIFDLYGLFNTSGPKNTPLDNYTLLVSVIAPSTADFTGSFNYSYAGVTHTINKSAMSLGTPVGVPSAVASHDGILPGYYMEIGFDFHDDNSENTRALSYNVAENTGGLIKSLEGEFLYQKFNFDVTNLDSGNILHFDLYNKSTGYFAAISHDAESKAVPEPLTMVLAASGLLMGGFGKRIKKEI